LTLSAARLQERLEARPSCSSSGSTVGVFLPSGSIIHLQQTNIHSLTEILCKVCEELKLDPEKYYIMKDNMNRVRLLERDYRIEKTGRSLGLTICAKTCDGGGVKVKNDISLRTLHICKCKNSYYNYPWCVCCVCLCMYVCPDMSTR
uniref:Ras association domain family member 1 n=1 Tax=Gongylonema pulchrum TaxID=637853 RepID=A0A183EP24_9BILA